MGQGKQARYRLYIMCMLLGIFRQGEGGGWGGAGQASKI